MSTNVNAVDEIPPAISPTKEEVKAKRDMLHSIAIGFERKLDSSSKKIESLESKSRSLANLLKEEKLKSRTAMEQLLLVTATQTNELIASFQDRFNKLKSNHNDSLRKLLRQRHLHQTSIDLLKNTNNKQMTQLESEYRASLTHVENQHNKKISCMRAKLSAMEASVKKKDSRQMTQLETEYRASLTHVENQHNKKISCMRAKLRAMEARVKKKDLRRKALVNEVHDLNEWILELDNERIEAETKRKGAVANERAAKKK